MQGRLQSRMARLAQSLAPSAAAGSLWMLKRLLSGRLPGSWSSRCGLPSTSADHEIMQLLKLMPDMLELGELSLSGLGT